MDFPQKAHIIHRLVQIEICPSQVTFLFVWPKPANKCKQTVLGAWATHFKITLQKMVPEKSSKNPSWQPLRFDHFRSSGNCTSTRLCRKFRPNLGVDFLPGKSGRSEQVKVRNVSLSGISTYPTQWERKLIFPTFSWDMLGSPRSWWVLLTTCMNWPYSFLASLLRLLLQLLLITSKGFSPSFLVDCYVMDEPLPQKSDLYLDWPPYYPPPSPTPPQATCICLKIIFR